MDFGFGGGLGDRQTLQNAIITIMYHEYFSHGTSTFTRNIVACCAKTFYAFFPKYLIEFRYLLGGNKDLRKIFLTLLLCIV
jgi:hypothetical protein